MEDRELVQLLCQHYVEMSLLHFQVDHGFIGGGKIRYKEEDRLAESAGAVARQLKQNAKFIHLRELQEARTVLTHNFLMCCAATDFRRDAYYQAMRRAITSLNGGDEPLNDHVNSEKKTHLKSWLTHQLHLGKKQKIASQLDAHLDRLLYAGESERDRGASAHDIAREKLDCGQVSKWILELLSTSIEGTLEQVGTGADEVLRSIAELMRKEERELNEQPILPEEASRCAIAVSVISKAHTALTLWDKIEGVVELPIKPIPRVVAEADTPTEKVEDVAEKERQLLKRGYIHRTTQQIAAALKVSSTKIHGIWETMKHGEEQAIVRLGETNKRARFFVLKRFLKAKK